VGTSFAGRTALVTGASLGIGRATALALAQAGANVAINYRSSHQKAEELAGLIREAGSEALLVQGDVADHATVERIVADTVARFGRLDVAVTNAVYSDRELFHQADLEGFRRTIDVTMWGAFYTLRASARQMISQPSDERGHRGAIVLISSPHAYIPFPRAMAYNMAKAAIDQMARTAAIELSEHRIRVNVMYPGWIDTPGERKFYSEGDLQAGSKNIPMGRLGNPEEIARAVLFLCDPANDYMTGATLLVDGGITLPWWARAGAALLE